jgi:hypothetical protein
MTTPQIKSMDAVQVGLSRAVLRYLRNKWFLLAAGGLAVAAIAVISWSWLVAAGIAWIVLSVLPCLVCCVAMCGLGLCMHKFLGGTQSSQAAASAAATSSDVQGIDDRAGAYAANCCGGGGFETPAHALAGEDPELKEKTHA